MIGRRETLDVIRERDGGINLVGLPGVGSTTVLKHLAKAPDAVYVDVHGHAEDCALHVIAALSADVSTVFEALDGCKGVTRIMLDHTTDCVDLLRVRLPLWMAHAPHIQWVCASHKSLMIPELSVQRLMGLSRDEAYELLRSLAPQWCAQTSTLVLDDLIELLDGHPLALTLACRRARLLTPEQLLSRLCEHLDGLTLLRDGVQRPSIHAMMLSCWQALDALTTRVICRMGVFQSPQPIEIIEQVICLDDLDLAQVLDALDVLDHAGALTVSASDVAVSRLFIQLAQTQLKDVEHVRMNEVELAHVRWVERLSSQWLTLPRATQVVAVTSCTQDVLKAWRHVTNAQLYDDVPSLQQIISTLMTWRTSTMTQLNISDLSNLPPVDVALARADQLWKRGQTQSAHQLLGRVASVTSEDDVMAMRVYAALARVQRGLSLWLDAAISFGRVADLARRSGDRTRSRRNAWRQIDALLHAQAHQMAIDVLWRLFDDDAPCAAVAREVIALKLAELICGDDPPATIRLLDAARHRADLQPQCRRVTADLDMCAGRWTSARAGYEAFVDDPLVQTRLWELALLTGEPARVVSLDAAKEGAPDESLHADHALILGIAYWCAGEHAQAISTWRALQHRSPAYGSQCSVLIATAQGDPLPERSSEPRVQSWLESLLCWQSGAPLPQIDEVIRPGALSAGWLARVLTLYPKTQHAHVPANLVTRSIRDGVWVVLRSGRGFVCPCMGFVSLDGKETLIRLLEVLARTHEGQPGVPLSFEGAFLAGWPDQLNTPEPSAKNRLRVAIRRLRDAGLRGLLATRSTGYLLDPDLTVHVHE